MLTSIIENYLTSIKEVQFFHPFMNLLDVLGFYDVHLLHGSNEFGKDIIAKKDELQFVFVIKVGDVNYTKYNNEVKGQIFEAQTNSLSHPNFVNSPIKVIFVTTGKVTSQVNIALQEHNNYSQKRKLPLVEAWTKDKLIKDFSQAGIEAFFNLHNNPQFIIDFYDTHSQILKDELFQSFDIEKLTHKWMVFDFKNGVNRLQVFFEAYYFSHLLLSRNRNYEALLFIAALVRVLSINNQILKYEEILRDFIFEIVTTSEYLLKENKILEKYNQTQGFLDIFYYPERCLETMELLSITILLNDDSLIDKFKKSINVKGCYRPLSDNYGVSVFLIATAMLKLDLIKDLKNYLVNCTVWICDRYEELGIAPIGSDKDLEYEQLLSEYLSGFENQKNSFSFIATIILDLCYYLKDKSLYKQISNELKSVEIAPISYHIFKEKDLWHYDNIISEHDPNFKTEMVADYLTMCSRYDMNKSYSKKLSVLEILCNIFLLRDRYYSYYGITKLIEKNK